MTKQGKNSENGTGSLSGKCFIITGAHYKTRCFPGLNDMLSEAARHPMAYNTMKRKYEFIAINAIRRQLRGYKAEVPLILHMTFGEPLKGRKRDYDNIVAAGRKIINDALVATGTIKDDSPKYLGYGTNSFEYTTVPFIRVEIEEVK